MITVLLTAILVGPSSLAQDVDSAKVYLKLEIHGLACPYCAFGMEKELKRISGVENVEIHLEEGLAFMALPASQQPTEELLTKIITEAGFTLNRMDVGHTPFDEPDRRTRRKAKAKNSNKPNN